MTTLLQIAEDAIAVGCRVEWPTEKTLLVFPFFKRELEGYSGDISFEIRNTLVGLRFVVVEHYAGFMLSPMWAEDLGTWMRSELRKWCSDFYWWTFRNIWGWQVSHPWESLEQAVALTTIKTRMFHGWCESTEVN